MRETAAKGRKLLFLAAGLALVGALLIPSSAEATRTLGPPITAALGAPRVTLETLENVTSRDQISPENRFQLFEDLGWPTHPLELLPVKKTASGVFDLGIECNIWQTGGLSQKCGSPSFQGLWTDPTTGLSYARNRWYDARTASWLSEDPMGDVDSPNLYAFVGWAPHVGRDPMGTFVVNEQVLSHRKYLDELRRLEAQLKTADPNITAGGILEAELKRRKAGVKRKRGGVISDNRFVLIDNFPIDMKHFLQVTALAQEHGTLKAELGSKGEELLQGKHKSQGARRSSFSPEDMPSNELGAEFGGSSRYDPEGSSLVDQLEGEFERIQDKERIKGFDLDLPVVNTPDWLDIFDYDIALTKPVQPQKSMGDFTRWQQFLINKVDQQKKRANPPKPPAVKPKKAP